MAWFRVLAIVMPVKAGIQPEGVFDCDTTGFLPSAPHSLHELLGRNDGEVLVFGRFLCWLKCCA